MKLNIENLKQLMNEECNGNYNAFAREIGINVAALYRVLNNQSNAGLKTINKIIAYLKLKKLVVEDYIFLP